MSSIDLNINNFDKIKDNFDKYQTLLDKRINIVDDISIKNKELQSYIEKIKINQTNLKKLQTSEYKLTICYREKNMIVNPNNIYKINQMKSDIDYLTKNIINIRKIEKYNNIDTSKLDKSILLIEDDVKIKNNILNELIILSKNLFSNVEKIKNNKKINQIRIIISQLASDKKRLTRDKDKIIKTNLQLINLSEKSQNQLINEQNIIIIEKQNKLKQLQEQIPKDNIYLIKLKLEDIKNDILNCMRNIEIFELEKNNIEKFIEMSNINLLNFADQINELEKLLPSDISHSELFKKELKLIENKEKILTQVASNNLDYDNFLILECDIQKYRFFLETQILNNEVELDCYNNSINKIEIEEQRKTIKLDYEQKADNILNDILQIKNMKKNLNNDLIILNTYLNSLL